MKWKKLVAIAIIAAILVVVIFFALVSIRVRGLGPEPLGMDYVLENAGTGGEVRIVRDENYLPHIIASNDEDLYFGLGFVMAQDRVSQMDMLRRAAEGRLSEILGRTPSYHGINLAGIDALIRTFRFREDAVEGYKYMRPKHRRLLDAYTRGINRYMKEIGDNLPFEVTILGIEPEPWRPEDSLAIWGLFGLTMSLDSLFNEYYLDRLASALGPEKARDFLPAYPQNAPIITASRVNNDFIGPFLALDRVFDRWIPHPHGSNNWAVSSSRTATGKAILCNDPHVPLNNIPTFWYHCHLKGGSYDVMGMVFPGSPVFGAGANGKIAWGITNVMDDLIDLFREKVNPENPNQYLYKDKWEDFTVVKGEIKIKGKKRPMPFSYRRTRHGSIIEKGLVGNYDVRKWAPGEVMAVKTVEADLATFFGGYLDLPKARNWKEFREACSRMSTGPIGWNQAYADADGNIGYQTTANVPVRADNQGIVINKGWTGEGDWIGRVPALQLPSLFNPSKGYLLSANNRVEKDDYPYYISGSYFVQRAVRINEFLASRTDITAQDMMELQADTVDPAARNALPYIIDDLEGTDDPKLERARNILIEWKKQGCRDDIDLVGPTVYYAFLRYMPIETFTDEMGKDLGRVLTERYIIQSLQTLERIFPDAQNSWFDDITTPKRETRRDITQRAMRQGLKWVGKVLGRNPEKWNWGNFHTITLGHPLAIIPFPFLRGKKPLMRGPYPHPGGDETVNNAISMSLMKKSGFHVVIGPSSRLIVDFSQPRAIYTSASTGMSANPTMPNYDNLTETWRKVDYIRMYIDEEKFIKNARGVITMKP